LLDYLKYGPGIDIDPGIIYLQRILKEHPEGDMLAKAQQLPKDMESPYYRPGGRYHGWSVPFKIVSPEDQNVPQEIKEWVSANTAQSFIGSKKTLGEWSYLLISAGEKPTAGPGHSAGNNLSQYFNPHPGQCGDSRICGGKSVIKKQSNVGYFRSARASGTPLV